MILNAEKFWEKVERRGPDECWPWTGYCIKPAPRRLGYGVYSYAKSKAARAHRVAYMLSVGPIPERMSVCHRCDNPPCCNPAHLWLGTYADNNRDRHAKGRTVFVVLNPKPVRGEQHGRAKLTWPLVKDIRRDTRSLSAIAAQYGVTKQTVHSIKRGETWSAEPCK